MTTLKKCVEYIFSDFDCFYINESDFHAAVNRAVEYDNVFLLPPPIQKIIRRRLQYVAARRWFYVGAHLVCVLATIAECGGIWVYKHTTKTAVVRQCIRDVIRVEVWKR